MSDEPIRCPKCHSTQIHVDKKGFSVGKAIAGGMLTGNVLVAAAAGGIGKDKIELTCLKCGHKFDIKDVEQVSQPKIQYKSVELNYKQGEFNTVICSRCGGKTLSSHKYCCQCGKLLDDGDERILLTPPLSVTTCKICNQLTTTGGKYCSKCGAELDLEPTKKGCAPMIATFIIICGTLALYLL